MQEFSTAIKDYRKEKKITQTEFAKKVGVNKSLLSRIESKSIPVTDKFISQVLNTFPDFEYVIEPSCSDKERPYINDISNIFIVKIRKYYSYTQDDFANQLGVTKSLISKIENGVISVSATLLEKLYWDFSVIELFNRGVLRNEIIILYKDKLKDPLNFLKNPYLRMAKLGEEYYREINCESKDLLKEVYNSLTKREKEILDYIITEYQKTKMSTIFFDSDKTPIDLMGNETFFQFCKHLYNLKKYHFRVEIENENKRISLLAFSIITEYMTNIFEDDIMSVTLTLGNTIIALVKK
jgi:transcriptional regulator with XRE-family HTH domain